MLSAKRPCMAPYSSQPHRSAWHSTTVCVGLPSRERGPALDTIIMNLMPGNSFGELFRVTTAGVSHGPGYVTIIDGCPPGLSLSVDDLLPDLRRRRPAQSSLVSQRHEED